MALPAMDNIARGGGASAGMCASAAGSLLELLANEC